MMMNFIFYVNQLIEWFCDFDHFWPTNTFDSNYTIILESTSSEIVKVENRPQILTILKIEFT